MNVVSVHVRIEDVKDEDVMKIKEMVKAALKDWEEQAEIEISVREQK